MLCDRCKKNMASLVIEENINGEEIKLSLCPSCAMEHQFTISFNDVLKGLLNFGDESFGGFKTKTGLECPNCGLDLEGFKRAGKLGCSECYETFNSELSQIYNRIQTNPTNKGKIPKSHGEPYLKSRAIRDYREELENALSLEEYEEAARLRDEIRELEADMEEDNIE